MDVSNNVNNNTNYNPILKKINNQEIIKVNSKGELSPFRSKKVQNKSNTKKKEAQQKENNEINLEIVGRVLTKEELLKFGSPALWLKNRNKIVNISQFKNHPQKESHDNTPFTTFITQKNINSPYKNIINEKNNNNDNLNSINNKYVLNLLFSDFKTLIKGIKSNNQQGEKIVSPFLDKNSEHFNAKKFDNVKEIEISTSQVEEIIVY
jgi:hypothetical protein